MCRNVFLSLLHLLQASNCSRFGFISRASDKCKLEKRKTINGDDLLYAMNALGFERYTEPLRSFLNRYRDVYIFYILVA